MKKTALILLIAILLLASVTGYADFAEYGVGDDVSGFSSTYLDGTTASGAVFSERTVSVVTYWSTWSGSALYNLTLLDRLSNEYSDVGAFGLLHEDATSTVSAAAQYMTEQGYAFPVFRSDSVWNALTSEASVIPQNFFVDANGVVLEIWYGAFANYAQLTERVDYWLGCFTDHYSVTFVDGLTDDIILRVDNVPHGGSVTPPEPPVHEGYVFSAWSSDEYTYVTSNMVITANYSPQSYRVRFFCSIDNALISTQYVAYGEAAVAPEPHSHSGYVFIGWSDGFDSVTAPLDVYAQYRNAQYSADGDLDQNGSVSTSDALLALRIAIGAVQTTDEYLLHGDMNGSGAIETSDALTILRIALGFG